MKRYLCVLLALLTALSAVPVYAAKTAEEPEYTYRTETFSEYDTVNTADVMTAKINIPNYMGKIHETLVTSEGSGEVDVVVVYANADQWVDGCYYGGVSIDLSARGSYIYPYSDALIYWKELYNYDFLPLEGGVYAGDDSLIQLHFLKGAGLYTGLANIFYSTEFTGCGTAIELLAYAPDKAKVCGAGYPFILILDDEMIDYFMKNGTLDKYGSSTWPELRKLIEEHRVQTNLPDPAEGLSNFTKKNSYFSGVFIDVDNIDTGSKWAVENIQKAYELGLVEGVGVGRFAPDGTVTLAQTITLAARINNIFIGESGSFAEDPSCWYKIYVNYAINHGIIGASDFDDYTRAATRAEVAFILGNCLPKEALEEINKGFDIPDVNEGTPYNDSIYQLYAAGVLEGNTARVYAPDRDIKRKELAAIICRMVLPETRISFDEE